LGVEIVTIKKWKSPAYTICESSNELQWMYFFKTHHFIGKLERFSKICGNWYSQQMADRLLVSSIASRTVQFSDFLC
jgi:hypothetical protein